MRPVRVTQTFPTSVPEAERSWYDTDGWPSWVDGLEQVVATVAPWPDVGGSVTWQSGPAGRGRVTERVVGYTAGEGQALDVADDSMTGRQTVAFSAIPEGVEVALALEYRLARRSVFTPVVDALFIRRAMTQSLARTLARFAGRLSAQPGPSGPR